MTSPSANSGAAPKRRLSPTLFGHVSREFLLPLGCCLGCFILLFMVADLFNDLQDLLEVKASVVTVLHYFMLLQPEKLVNILPMSILLACGYMVSNLTRNHEISAIRAAGISMTAVFLPVWLVAALFAVISFFLVETVAPTSSAKAKALLQNLKSPGSADVRPLLASRNSRAHRDWFFESFSSDGEQKGVLIKQFRTEPNGRRLRVAWEIRAATAHYTGGHWMLEKGSRVEYDMAGGLPANSAGTPFDVLDCPDITESPREIFGSMRPTEELSIREMLQLLATREDLARSSRNIYWTQIWFRLSAPFSCLGAALVGIALSLGAHRGSRMLGFGIALGVLVLYYFAGRLFVVLGQYGYLPAVVAGTLPTLLLAAWGVWEMRRRN